MIKPHACEVIRSQRRQSCVAFYGVRNLRLPTPTELRGLGSGLDFGEPARPTRACGGGVGEVLCVGRCFRLRAVWTSDSCVVWGVLGGLLDRVESHWCPPREGLELSGVHARPS